MTPELQVPGEEHDQEDHEHQPDETAAPGQCIVSTAEAKASPNYGQNQNDDENQYERTHDWSAF